jgi:hypothetical protein
MGRVRLLSVEILDVNSGYIRFGEAPGNVLLAFSAKEQ